MFNKPLRKTIQALFPGSYSRWSWRKLLPDFVDVLLTAYLVRRDVYRESGRTEAAPVDPVLKPACRLRAKTEGLTYDVLAVSYYLMQYELAASIRECSHLRDQLRGYQSLADGALSLADQTMDQLQNLSNPDPDNRPN